MSTVTNTSKCLYPEANVQMQTGVKTTKKDCYSSKYDSMSAAQKEEKKIRTVGK